MSPFVSSRLMATCWLTLAVCVVGLWCHPVPDKNNNTQVSAPAFKKVDDLGQLIDLTDNDYPDMVTDFLRLSTTIPTVAASTKAFVVTTSSTLSPSTTVKTTIKPSTLKNSSTSATTKAFEVATAKFFPSVAPAVMTTTENPTPTVRPATESPDQKLQSVVPVAATPMPLIEKLQKTNKPASLNEIEPLTKSSIVVQTTVIPPTSSVPQQQQKLIFDAATKTQQSPIIQTPVIEQQQQQKPTFSGSMKQPAVSAVQRQPVAVLNQPQQQQMAVSGAPSIQQQPTNLVQTAASIASRQQQQQQNVAPMSVRISTQQQPLMQIPTKMQPPMMPNPAQSAMQQQMMMQNPAMMQQMMMRNPAFQQQQFQLMLPNRTQFQAKTATTVRPGVKQATTPVMTLINNPLFGSNRRPVFFLGGNGTPTNLLPISALPQLLSPPVAPTTRPV